MPFTRYSDLSLGESLALIGVGDPDSSAFTPMRASGAIFEDALRAAEAEMDHAPMRPVYWGLKRRRTDALRS